MHFPLPARARLLLVGSCGYLTATLATQGLGIRVSNQDAHATARGNAFAATADNPSALYYNPAGITQGSGWNVRAGLYSILLESEYAGGPGVHLDTMDEPFVIPQFYATYAPEDCRFAYGLGIYSPYGLGSLWESSVPFRAVGYRANLVYATVNPILAWRITDTLSVAAGPTFNYGKFTAELGIGTVTSDRLKFRGENVGMGFNAGIRWQPTDQHAFGISYRSRDSLDFDGHAGTFVAGAVDVSEPSELGFDFPQTLTAGYSFRPTPAWNLEVNVDWTDWDQVDASRLSKPSGDLILPLFWESSFIYKFGASRRLDNGYVVSAGYWFAEETVPDANFTTLVNDQDLHVFSVGVGHRGESWDWDATFQYGHGPTRDVTGSLPFQGQSADGSYQLRTLALSFSVSRRF